MTVDEFDRQFGIAASPAVIPIAREDEADTEETRRTAARRYLNVVGVDRLSDNMIHEAAKLFSDAQRPEFFRVVQRLFPPGEMERLMMELCVKYFTRRELEALADFYASSEGQSIITRGVRITGPPVPSEGGTDTPEDRRVAAQRYAFEIDMRRLYGQMARAAARGLSSLEDSEKLLWQMDREYRDFERELLDNMAKYNTRREIDALTRFYTSRDGRATMVRMPLMMEDFFSYLVDALRREGIPIAR